jgi:hypothetical protein
MYKLQVSEISPELMHLYVQRKMQILLNNHCNVTPIYLRFY